MSSSVDQIKSRIDIVSLVSSYMKLEKAGANFKGKCPFHNEKTPSFFVSPERGSYYCFGCGASGDIFTFVEEFEGLDFKGALKLLAERAGVKLEKFSREESESVAEKERLYHTMEEATLYFENNLKPARNATQRDAGGENKDALEYLKSRGLTEKSVNDFRIGYAPTDWRELYSYLKASGFSDMEIEKAGLAKRTDKGYYDRFRGRIMFPINDSSGRVIAFSGRLFPDDEKSAKYLNSPETPLFSKSSVLFGIDKAKDSIRKNNFSILVEGQIDLVLSHQAGFKNTIASSGTAVSDVTLTKENIINNLGLVRRLSKNIVLAYDGDSAGVNAANRFAKVALSIGMDVKVASMEEGSDPADIISTQGADAWHKAVRESKHFIEFMLGKILKDAAGDGRKVGRGVRERLLPFVHDLESSIEKSHFISLISDRTGISEKALTEDLQKIESELKYEKDETYSARESAEKKLRKDPIERRLMGIAYWQASLSERAVDPELIFNKLSGVRAVYNEIKEDLIFEAEEFYLNSENLQKDVREMLSSIEEEYLNEEIVKKMIELRESKGEVEEIDILKKINEINKIKEDIKNSR